MITKSTSENEDYLMDFAESSGISQTSKISHENLQLILQGVENGDKDKLYYFGLLKLYGISVTKSFSMAGEYFIKAADLGNKDAMTAVGMMYMTGLLGAKDLTKAKLWFHKAMDLDDLNAFWLMGKLILENSQNEQNNYVEAARMFKIAADKGLAQAEYSLAVMYEYGLGVEESFELAAAYYRGASEKSHIESMFNLAMMYATGRGIPQDFNRARPLLESAATANHPPSIYYIGVFKARGYGCDVNYYQAINWFERAAGFDDYRISDKAARAAKELIDKVAKANEYNELMMDIYQRKSDIN